MARVEAAYSAAVHVSSLLLPVLARGGGKVARGVRGRRGALERLERWGAEARHPDRPLFWFHAPSVGEGLQARAVMEALRSERPDAHIVYTFFSPSAESFAASTPADVVDYLPLDLPAVMGRLVDALRPAAIAFTKTEVWPNLTRAAEQRGIPLFLLSATLPEGSSRLRLPGRFLLGPAHRRLTAVAAISRSDSERYRRLGVPADRRTVMGDARYDQVWSRAQRARAGSELTRTLSDPQRLTLLAGSTWPADEDRLVSAFSRIERRVGRPRLILVPHEPTPRHLVRLERLLAREGLESARLSAATVPAISRSVLIVDRVGVLGELYALADIAYVGGGFGTAGLHSVLEPAAFGVPVLFGPRHGNAREAGELIAGGGAFSVADGDALRETLEELFVNRERRGSAGFAAAAFVARGVGAAARGARLLLNALLSSGNAGGSTID